MEARSVPVGPHHPSGSVRTNHRSDADLLAGDEAQEQEHLVTEPLRGVQAERTLVRDRLDDKGELVHCLWPAGLSKAEIPTRQGPAQLRLYLSTAAGLARRKRPTAQRTAHIKQ